MTIQRYQVALHTADANPANYATNTWWMDVLDANGTLNVASALSDFYGSLVTWFPDTLAQNGHTITAYEWTDPTPRAPIFEGTFNLPSAPTQDPMPSEVALCLSFQATRTSGQSQARRRGRLYIGPLQENANDASGRPNSTVRQDLADAAEAMLAQSVTDTDWLWAIYSTVNDNISYVANGWVDDAWDTQRRRGLEVTTRTLWP